MICALIGTSQLSVDDWVSESVKETPDPNSKMCKYICKTGVWNKSHVLFWAYHESDFSRILCKDDLQ